MKRALSLLLFILLFCTLPACAEPWPIFIHAGDSGFPLEYLCQVVGAEIHYEESYVSGYRSEVVFDEDVRSALERYQRENHLWVTYCFDEDTLCHILDLPAGSSSSPLVWIPMHRGAKYHVDPECSGMSEPRQMPLACAKAFLLTDCKRCDACAMLAEP